VLEGSAPAVAQVGQDRHRTPVVRVAAGGRDLADALVAEGLAFAAPGAEAGALSRRRALEGPARAARLGLWADPALAEQPAERVAPSPPRFAVVTGRVARYGTGDRWLYLNFGEDRRTDFTVRVAARARTAFRRAGVDLAALAARRVRVRGWIAEQDGAMMELVSPEQIEVLE
jgi:hypothetical protein